MQPVKCDYQEKKQLEVPEQVQKVAALLRGLVGNRGGVTSEMSSRRSENNSIIQRVEKKLPNIACKMSLEFYMLSSWLRFYDF